MTPTEFWRAVDYVTRLGQSNEAGLLVAGLGLEHFLDILLDEEERKAGLEGGTPRTIEGPLWLAGAPLAQGEARLDQDPEPDAETIVMTGQVRDPDGNPVPGAVVDVWHANTKGGYSFFDSSQSAWNLRRRIRTDGDGRYAFRSIMPVGYGCPPEGTTQELLDRSGDTASARRTSTLRRGARYRKLTTQINIAGTVPPRGLRLRDPRRTHRRGPARDRPGGDRAARAERTLLDAHLRLHAQPGGGSPSRNGGPARPRDGSLTHRARIGAYPPPRNDPWRSEPCCPSR